jgi:ABC-type branched-subunit amino acid transport system substrate-binding protein
MIAHVSESAKITGDECSRYTFRVAANMALEANTLIDWALKNMGKKIFLLGADYAFGRSASEEYRKVIERLGGKVVGESFFPLNNKDFAPYFGKIKAATEVHHHGWQRCHSVVYLLNGTAAKLMKIAG